jgi:hypothetical protein
MNIKLCYTFLFQCVKVTSFDIHNNALFSRSEFENFIVTYFDTVFDLTVKDFAEDEFNWSMRNNKIQNHAPVIYYYTTMSWF